MKLDSFPITTNLIDDTKNLTTPWMISFRNLYNNLKDAQTIVSASNYQYCIFGNQLTLNYSGISETVIKLPYQISNDQVINYWDGGVLKPLYISKGSFSITVPNGIIKFTATILVRQS